ncbi:MAG: hypothetical protein K9M02_16940 [Thiohalocapsa sp.]|nr:hypothetical protein [Thiohalocapsa sp.]
MNIDDLTAEPFFLESTKRMTRYLIDPADRGEAFADTEWFCNDCGALIEDTFEGCPDCRPDND